MHAGRTGQHTGQAEEAAGKVALLHVVQRSVQAVIHAVHVAMIGGGCVAAVRVLAGALRLQLRKIGVQRDIGAAVGCGSGRDGSGARRIGLRARGVCVCVFPVEKSKLILF